jgi:hypothetical protein
VGAGRTDLREERGSEGEKKRRREEEEKKIKNK